MVDCSGSMKGCSHQGEKIMRLPQARRITALIGFVVCSLAISAQAQALTGTLKKIADSHSITVGIRQALLPFSYYDNNQQVIGRSEEHTSELQSLIRI